MTERPDPPRDAPHDAIAAVTHPDPYPWYAALVAERPFHYDARLKLWIAASAEAVTAVLQSDLCHVRPAAEPVPRHLGSGAAAQVFRRLVRMRDDPQREAVKQALLAALAALSPEHIVACAGEVLAALRDERLPPDAWLFELPVRSMAALLGLPPQHRAEAARCTGDFVRGLLPQATPEQVSRGDAAAERLRDLLRSHGGLLPAEDETMLCNALGLMVQAHDATAGLLGNALVLLQRQPELQARLREEPSLMPDFVRELLRFDAPVQNTRRFMATDGEIAGQSLQRGDAILVLLAAANRDPAANARPQRFIIDRPQRRLFGFGLRRHECAGPEIAALIAGAGIQYWVNHDLAIPPLLGYRDSANARIPRFA